jgi:VCBS repeat-containing protein
MERSKPADIAINPKNSPLIANVAATVAITAGYGFGDELSTNAAINSTGINNAPLISGGVSWGTVLFYDNFDSGSLSSEWKSVWPTQWVKNGWLHTRDTNGWPRDSEALVHDGDVSWRNYSVSLTAGFTPGTPWDNFNVLFRADGFSRSSAGRRGNAYQLNFSGSSGWGSGGQSVSLTRSQGTQNTDLFVGPWTPIGPSANIVASLDEGHIQVSVDGKKIIDLADPSPLLYGGIGVHAIWESEAQFDNIVVKDIFSQQDFKIAENIASGTTVDTVTATDSDAGDTLIYTITAGNSDPDSDSNLAFAINPNTGTITVNDSGDLDYETTTQLNLEVKVTDAGGLSDTGAVTVALTNVDEPGNERPEAQDATFTLPENSPTSTTVDTVTATDVDAGDTLTYAITAGNSNPDGESNLAFAIDSATGKITVNDSDDLNFETTPTFNLTVKVTDVGGLFDTAAIKVNLTNINESPIAADDTGIGYQTAEDKAFTTANVLSNDTDPDGDILSISNINTTGTKGIATNNGNGTFNYNPNGKFDYLKVGEQATDHFLYTVSDDKGGSDTATITIAISGVDDAPKIDGNIGSGLVLWNRFETKDVVVPDVLLSEVGPDIHLRNYLLNKWTEAKIIPGKFGNGLYVNNDIVNGWDTNGANFFGTSLEEMSLTSQQGTIEYWFTFKYDSSTHDHAYFFHNATTLTGHFPGNSIDQNRNTNVALAAGWSGWSSNGKKFFLSMDDASDSQPAVSITTPRFSAAPGGSLGFVDGTTYHFAFAWDSSGIDSSSDTMRIYVDGVNVASGSAALPAGVFDPYLYVGTAPNSGSLSTFYDAVKGVSDNLKIWNYAKTDYSDRFAEGTYSPLAFSLPENGTNGTAVGTVTATDVDAGDTLSYAITAGNSDSDGNGNLAFAIDSTTGQITVNDSGDLDYESTHQFDLEVTVTDTASLSDTTPVTITLTNVDEPGNERPETQDATFTLPENSPTSTAVGTVTATDVEAGDTLTYAITAGNSNPDGDSNLAFTINPTTGAITVNDRGDLDFETTPTFNLTVKVTDVGGLFDAAAIKVNLTNINESPIAADDTGVGYQTDEDKAFTTANVLSNDTDPDGDNLSISGVDTTSTQGTVTNNGNGTFNYNPNGKVDYLKGGEQSTDSFTYTVSDSRGGTDTATVTFKITGVNDAPKLGGATPVLWNRLGSREEVLNSEIGLDGTFIGGGFTQGVFGDAYTANYTQNNLVTFPYQVVPYQEGTLEFWAKLTAPPVTVPWGHSPYLVLIQDGDNEYSLGINGNNGLGGGGVTSVANGFTTATSSYANTWTYGSLLDGQPEGWHHYALVWNKDGISGIDNGTRKLALFLDGQLNSGYWLSYRGENYQLVPLKGGTLGLNYVSDNPSDPRPPYRGSVAIDNLKIWDYSKTDYYDRFTEGTYSPLAFTLPENGTNGTAVGTVTATDVDAGDTLTYAITAGNSDPDGDSRKAFAINSTTGAITVNDSGDLDYETTPQFNLEVKVTDAAGLSDTGAIAVALTNVAEPGNDRPEAQDASFSVPEKAPFGSAVGIAPINDVDAGDTLTFAILTGNSDPDGDGKAAFAINSTTGAITVNDSGDLILKVMPQLKLQVAATDTSGLSDTSEITVTLNNINDDPAGADKTVVMAKNSIYTFKVSDFGFTDPNDSPANSLLAVKVHTLPLSGTLTYSGVSVSAEQIIPVTGISGGLFTFAPVTNTTGTGYANLSFQVQDDGGIANGGLDLDPTPNNISINVTAGGGSWGDPHMFTFDGLHYDFQATGDFILVRALDSDLKIHVKQAPWQVNPQTTLNVGLATVIVNSDVVFDVSQPHPLVNGSALMLAMGESQPLGGGSLSRTSISNYGIQGDLYTLSYATGDRLDVQLFPNFCIDPTVYLIHSQQVVGLLGNNNGRAGDDLALRDGTMPPDPLAAEHLYGAFATDWLVAPADSLFTRMEQAVATPSLPQEDSSPAALAGPAAEPLAALAPGDALAPTGALTSLEAAGEHPDLLIQPGFTSVPPAGILGTGMVDTQWSGWQAELEVSAISPPLGITDPNQATTFPFPSLFGTDLTDALPNNAAL